LQLSNITVDTGGPPCGYIDWYNHYNEISKIRPISPALKNDKFGVQGMEMLAIYFASADNCMHFRDIAKAIKKKLLLRMTYNIFQPSMQNSEYYWFAA
jgi:hypothetical protein